uniref:Uncharacterized protein n=1 Tax=Rhodosorus marinus TaxID=101924 RepID=A0A7S0BIU1_9RHOD|mmetsp:Transcript_16175/g.23469  ORF Transcript_16175/g.23469 Transcript_16175/m.23469 type:complete len:188 (+) Transcript_16175:73-636(+)
MISFVVVCVGLSRARGQVRMCDPYEGMNIPSVRPNINKFAAQRSTISTEKSAVKPEEMNDLLVKNGKKARNLYRIRKSLHFSSLVVSARLVLKDELVAMARALTDGALNSTIWDVLVDPELPDPDSLKRQIMERTLKELREMVPGCSIALIAPAEDTEFYESNHSFRADANGVKLMALQEENWDITL